jgi:hypothetical protein
MNPRIMGALLISCVAMKAHSEPSPQAGPALEGVILVSPNRPGPTRKDAPEAAPAGNLTFEVTKDDQKVGSFTTDGEGHFQLTTPPGHYVIERTDPGVSAGQWRFEADVAANKSTAVRWTADSGMR